MKKRKEKKMLGKVKGKSLIELSFDDGNVLDLKVAYILKKYELTGTFFIIVDMVGKDGYLNWDEIKELDKSRFAIGSHTMTHPSDLKTLYDEDLHYEIQNSKDMLEAVLGHTVSRFCYPRGRYDDRVKSFVAKAGYTYARGTGKPGVLEVKDDLEIPGSVHIYQRKEYGGMDILTFAKKQIDIVKESGGYCNIFSHSWELERDGNWDILEEVCKYVIK